MKKISLIILLFAATVVNKVAAQQSMFSVQYSVAYGTGKLHDFICNTSWRGATMDYRKYINGGQIGIGGTIGWNAFYKAKLNHTFVDGTKTITGDSYNYSSSVPIMAAADYYFSPNQKINPFVGLGIGTTYTQDDLDMGLYTYQLSNWHFSMQPELGVIVSPSPGFGIIISGKYYTAFKTSTSDAHNYFATNIGFVWQY